MPHRFLPSLTVLVTAAFVPAQNPACADHSGMPWVHPFTKAKETAAAQNRLLLVKPIAFGTSADGGW